MNDSWNAEHYLKFGSERTRPALELVARIHRQDPSFVVDLGCGPGNSTQVLSARWPDAQVAGVDSSQEMIKAAKEKYPEQSWLLGDISEWSGQQKYDVVFSNAVFHWLPDHHQLMPTLMSRVAKGGVLGFQIPCDKDAPVRQHIRELALEPQWRERLASQASAITFETPEFYYDALAKHAKEIDIWQTTYYHQMENPAAIVDWISSTGLRPYLALLDAAESEQFLLALRQRVKESYPSQLDGKVLFPFQRLFVIAYK